MFYVKNTVDDRPAWGPLGPLSVDRERILWIRFLCCFLACKCHASWDKRNSRETSSEKTFWARGFWSVPIGGVGSSGTGSSWTYRQRLQRSMRGRGGGCRPSAGARVGGLSRGQEDWIALLTTKDPDSPMSAGRPHHCHCISLSLWEWMQ